MLHMMSQTIFEIEQISSVPPIPDPYMILSRARRHSTYYRERLRGVKYWSQVPILQRDEVPRVPVIGKYGKVSGLTTSGSMGYKLKIFATRKELFHRVQLMYRPYAFYPQLGSFVRQAIFVDGSEREENEVPSTVKIHGRVFYRYNISARVSAQKQWARLLSIRPHMVTGFPSAMVRFVEEVGTLAKGLGVCVVSPAGELLRPVWRTLLETTFDAPVYDRFGATECGALAWECPLCRRYHANTDAIFIEPHTDIGCVVTSLFQRAQPLLRYNLGDQLQWDDGAYESCSIKLPRIRILDGRRDDWLYDLADRKISPLCFEFEKFEFVTSWSIHQNADGSIEVYVTSNEHRTDELTSLIVRHVGNIVAGRKVLVRDKPENIVTGKFKRVRSYYRPNRARTMDTPANSIENDG